MCVDALLHSTTEEGLFIQVQVMNMESPKKGDWPFCAREFGLMVEPGEYSWKVAATEYEDHAFVVRGREAIDVHGRRSLKKLLGDWDNNAKLGRVFDSPYEARVFFETPPPWSNTTVKWTPTLTHPNRLLLSEADSMN